MDKDIMIRWICRMLEQATENQVKYLMYFIRGYTDQAATGTNDERNRHPIGGDSGGK